MVIAIIIKIVINLEQNFVLISRMIFLSVTIFVHKSLSCAYDEYKKLMKNNQYITFCEFSINFCSLLCEFERDILALFRDILDQKTERFDEY
jgi:hypothetical protein